MKHILRSFVLVLGLYSTAMAVPIPHPSSSNNTVGFIENKGQIHNQYGQPRTDIQFQLSAANCSVYIGNGALHYQFSKVEDAKNGSDEPSAVSVYRMDVTLTGANPNAHVIYSQPQTYYEQYYTNNTGTNGTKVHSFGSITYENIYPGIDWVLYTRSGKLKHEFVVKPGGKTSDIQLQYAGATSVHINPDGSLTAETPFGHITEEAPYSHDDKGRTIASSFQLHNNLLTYRIEDYRGTLTIDPTITWATYYGGTGTEMIRNTTTDAAGNVYLMMETTSTGLATTGAFLTSVFSSSDASMIVQFNSAGVRQWATYYGSGNNERTYAGATDIAGNLYVVGSTRSTINIATPGAFSTSIASSPDGYIVKFDNTGSRIWGTYYGGVWNDELTSVAVDNVGNIFVAGYSYSGLMATAGAHQTTHGSITLSPNGILAKFSSSGARLWATYYGDTADVITDIATDAAGNVYATGYTHSPVGIASAGAFQPSHASILTASDAFLVKFNGSGVRQWGTYYGSAQDDTANAIAIDNYNNIYIGGVTRNTTNVLATPGAHQPLYASATDGFLAKFDTSGQRLWGTYYGGGQYDNITDICVNGAENVYITGRTLITSSSSTAISSTPGTPPAASNAYYAKFNSLGVRQWGYIYGGSLVDNAFAITNVSGGGFYMAGQTSSTTGIATAGSHQPTKSTGLSPDGYLAKFSDCLLPDAGTISGFSGVCIGGTTTLSVPVSGGVWSASNANATITSGGVLTGVTAGIDTISYTITNSCGTTVATKVVTVNTASISITGSSTVCVGSTTTLSSVATGGTWISTVTTAGTIGSSSGIVTGIAAGTTVISYAMPGCSTARTITVNPLPGTISPLTGCLGASTTLTCTPAGGTWGSSNPSVATIGLVTGIATGAGTGTARITYSLPTSCRTISVLTINPIPAAITGATTVCEASTTTLASTTTGGNWTSTGGATIGSSTGLLTGTAAGTAVATYMLTATGCFVTHTVTVNPVPAPITGSTFMTCAGSSITLVTTSTGGNWTSGSTGVATIGITTGIVNGLSAGTASITYSFPTTACRTTAVVTVYAIPTAITGSASLCMGTTATLASSPTGGSWSSGSPSVATITPTGGAITTVAAGTTVISYTMPAGCAAIRIITVEPLPASITASGFSVCEGQTTTLSCTTTGGTWSINPTAVASITTGGTVTGVNAGSATASYTLPTGCRSVATVTVVNMPGPIGGPSEVCDGATITLTNSEAGGIWSMSGGAAISSGGVFTGATPGIVTVSYMIGGMCFSTKDITVKPLPDAGSVSGPAEVCPGADITLTASVPGGAWIASNSNATVTGGIVMGVSAGTVTISYLVTNTCGTDVSSQIVTVKTPEECMTGILPVNGNRTTLLCYPSPNNGSFSISLLHTHTEVVYITITDVLGRKVYQNTINTNKECTVSIQTPGIYSIGATCSGAHYSTNVLVK